MKKLLLIYEHDQVDIVLDYVRNNRDVAVITIDAWVELELQKRGISTHPFTNYIPNWRHFDDLLYSVEKTARQWYELSEMAFFKHKNVSLGEITELIVDIFLHATAGNVVFFNEIFKKHPDMEEMIIPHPTQGISAGVGPLARFQIEVITEVGQFMARKYGVPVKLIGNLPKIESVLFPSSPFFQKMALEFYNFLIKIFVSQKPIRLYVSDHWKNIKAFIEKMDGIEVTFVDRKELKLVPWRKLFKHRMRFIHPLDALTHSSCEVAKSKAGEFGERWRGAKSAVSKLPGFTYGDIYWWPLVEKAFDFLIGEYSARIVADMESIELVLKKEKINRAMMRASVSGQHHFYIMGLMSRFFGAPSMELQHGIGVGIFPEWSAFGHMHADYVLSYGPLIRRAFEKNGDDPNRVILTGSPRFDRYFYERKNFNEEERNKKIKELGLDPKRPVITVIMTDETPGPSLSPSCYNSYEFRDIIKSLKDIQDGVPNAQFIIKFRALSRVEKYKDYVREIFGDRDFIIEYGDAFSLTLLSDFIICSFSTVATEALMADRPIILFPMEKGDDYFYDLFREGVFVPSEFPEEGIPIPIKDVINFAKRLAEDKEFYDKAVLKGQKFLRESFVFDGMASEHVAKFLRNVKLPT